MVQQLGVQKNALFVNHILAKMVVHATMVGLLINVIVLKVSVERIAVKVSICFLNFVMKFANFCFILVINKPWRFSGSGTLSFNPLLRPIQLPWLNALSLRTLQPDAFLMSVQVGQNSSSVLSVRISFSNFIQFYIFLY